MSLIISNPEETEISILSQDASGKISVVGSDAVKEAVGGMIEDGLFASRWEKHDKEEVFKSLPINAESPEAVYAVREGLESLGYKVYEHSDEAEAELREMVSKVPANDKMAEILEVLPEMSLEEQATLRDGLLKIFEAKDKKG